MDPRGFFLDIASFTEEEKMLACFKMFDKDKDMGLNAKEFDVLVRALLTGITGKPYPITVSMVADLFCVFDVNKDKKIDQHEFESVWDFWIKPILLPVTALLIIDVESDRFTSRKDCSDQENITKIILSINDLATTTRFDVVVYALDCYQKPQASSRENSKTFQLHSSSLVETDQKLDGFEEYPSLKQKVFLTHRLPSDSLAQLSRNLKLVEDALFIFKCIPTLRTDGMDMTQTSLDEELKKWKVNYLFVCGSAGDINEASACMQTSQLGYVTVIISDASRGLSTDVSVLKQNLISNNRPTVTSSEIKDIVTGKDRRPDLAYKLGMTLKKEAACVDEI